MTSWTPQTTPTRQTCSIKQSINLAHRQQAVVVLGVSSPPGIVTLVIAMLPRGGSHCLGTHIKGHAAQNIHCDMVLWFLGTVTVLPVQLWGQQSACACAAGPWYCSIPEQHSTSDVITSPDTRSLSGGTCSLMSLVRVAAQVALVIAELIASHQHKQQLLKSFETFLWVSPMRLNKRLLPKHLGGESAPLGNKSSSSMAYTRSAPRLP
jgi:hypothetical protein